MTSEPQTDVCLAVVPITNAIVASPDNASNQAVIFAVPDGANFQIELLSVTYVAHVLPVDGVNVNFDLEFVDDSDSDTVADILATFTMDDNRTAVIGNLVWRGSQILDPGDAVNLEYDVATPSTAGQGAAVVVEYRVLRHS